jgi:GNAT superfamily N-acetyltransferase
MNGGAEKAWSIRPYRQGDDRAVRSLYESVLGCPFDEAIWKWQFEGALTRPSYIYFAERGDTLVGQYATLPVRMRIRGREAQASLSLDTMTHPEYRRQGIFLALARAVYRDTRTIGVDLVYGFPNDSSAHGFIADLGFSVLENLVAMTRPICIDRVLQEKANIPLLGTVIGKPLQGAFNALCLMRSKDPAIRIEYASEFPETVTALFEECARNFENLTVRDYGYLHWRYDRNPRHSYEILLGYRGRKLAGYCVTGQIERKGLRVGLIVDILSDPSDRELTASLVTAAIETMKRAKMHIASCLLPSKSPYRAVLRRLGFILPMRRFPFIVRANSESLPAGALADTAGWHITFGDGDFA